MITFKKIFVTLLLIGTVIGMSACSNNKTSSATSIVENMQKVETGTIVSVKTIALKPEEINSYGNVGVSVGTGGSSGVYGSVDLATIGKLYRNATKPTTAQQFIIKKSNGETVAITQEKSREEFKIGDAVKLLIKDGKAKVIH
jgi:outer membrane lipoprotein SlyB